MTRPNSFSRNIVARGNGDRTIFIDHCHLVMQLWLTRYTSSSVIIRSPGIKVQVAHKWQSSVNDHLTRHLLLFLLAAA